MENNIVISNTANFETTKENIRKDGLEKLCVLSDFDKTLTYATVENERTPSMISFLRKDKKYLGEDYIKRATMLAEKYIPIEFNPKLDPETKRRSMEKWWRSHLELLIEKKLNRKHFAISL
jgi:cytosolic 5'-nucleotidase 3